MFKKKNLEQKPGGKVRWGGEPDGAAAAVLSTFYVLILEFVQSHVHGYRVNILKNSDDIRHKFDVLDNEVCEVKSSHNVCTYLKQIPIFLFHKITLMIRNYLLIFKKNLTLYIQKQTQKF